MKTKHVITVNGIKVDIKFITKLQSYTDVITNSSSTVFLMHKENAEKYEKEVPDDCCWIQEINEKWLKEHLYEWEFIFEFLDIDKTEISRELEYWYNKNTIFWETPDEELWEWWIDENKELLQEKLYGLYFVDIEDHFEDSWEYINSVEHSADNLYSEYRH